MNKRYFPSVALLLLMFWLVACPSAKDTTAPELSLTVATTATSTAFTVQGKASDTRGVVSLMVKVNDGFPVDAFSVLADDGTFEVNVTLEPSKKNTITVTAEDAAGNASEEKLDINVQVAPATIAGHLWQDANNNGKQDAGEANLAGRTLYLDQNDNKVFDQDEVNVKTDAEGNYRFTGLTQGSYIVRQVLPFGEKNTFKRGVNLLSQTTLEPQIVGGAPTTLATFPFMLALAQIIEGEDGKQGFAPVCGATLVTAEYVLTAAHCIENAKLADLRVMLEVDTLQPDTKAKFVPISAMMMHPQYTGESHEGYDVALLKLKDPVALTGNTYTVDVNADTAIVAADTLATAAGWGRLSQGGDLPRDLQMVHLPILKHDTCQEILSKSTALKNFETQLCAGVLEGGIDACQGDSGGPLLLRQLEGDKQRWLQVGVTSWGKGCAKANSPGVWADTAVLYPWLLANTSGESLYYAVHVGETAVTGVDFANQSTTRPFRGAVLDRWQVTSLSSSEGRALFKPNKPLDFLWNILADNPSRNYTCSLKLTEQSNPPKETVHEVACSHGANKFTLPDSVSGGVYVSELSLESDGIRQTRQTSLTAIATEISGKLEKGDAIDPDYLPTNKFYIDYYDFSGVPVGTTISLHMTGNAPVMELWVYNKATRLANKGGGALELIFPSAPGILTIQKDVDYLIGITTGRDFGAGDYTIMSTAGTFTPFEWTP